MLRVITGAVVGIFIGSILDIITQPNTELALLMGGGFCLVGMYIAIVTE
jgi:hypothetical protein